MKTNEKKEKLITRGLVILLLLSSIGAGVYFFKSKTLQKAIDDERIKSEKLLSEKLLVEKDIAKFEDELNSLKGKNELLDETISEANMQLSKKQKELERLIKQNAKVAILEQKLSEVKTLKSEFENQVAVLTQTISQLQQEKDEMNKELASLQSENKQLAENLEVLSAMTANNFLIESQRSTNGKLTVLARRTKKMVVSFDIPQHITTSISFKITTPDGKVITEKENDITYKELDNENRMVASVEQEDKLEVSKRIEMTYQPKSKLNPGIYKIEIINNDKRMGNCQIKLR